jgi:DNA-binding FadR family transcriptional regulator
LKDKRLYHSVADRIKGLIDDGTYQPGSRLPGERELAEQFDVSRVTIREAEIALQALGRLDIRTGSGVYVLDVSDQRNGGLPDVSAFELTEARSLFESEAAALAAAHMTDEILAKLEKDTRRMGDPALDEQEAENADRDFHLTIAEASGNKAILHVVRTFWRMRTEIGAVKEVYDSVCSEEPTARGEEHADILEALRNRNPDAARKSMRRHFTRLLESMLDATEEQAMEELRRKARESRERFLGSAQI